MHETPHRAKRLPRPPLVQVLGLACAAAVGLGIARFAYALILPDMRADLGWSYSAAGWLNTTNALGYLAGALLAAHAKRRVGAFRTVQIGVWMCIASLAICVVLRDPILLNIARIVAGVGAGLAFVSGGFLAARLAARDEGNAILLGLFYAGPGFGIALSGMSVPLVLAKAGPDSWPLAWGLLAIVSTLLAFALRLGRPETEDEAVSRAGSGIELQRMVPILIGYAFYGAGYIGYMTFVIAWVRANGAGVPLQASVFIVIGLGAMASPWLWGRFMKRTLNGTAFAVLTATLALGSSFVALSDSSVLLFLSAGVVGATFLAVVASTTAFVRRNFSIDRWTAGIGAMTISFGIGQILGPVGVGLLSDMTGGVAAGQWISTGLLVTGAAIGFLQSDLLGARKS